MIYWILLSMVVGVGLMFMYLTCWSIGNFRLDEEDNESIK